MDIMDYYKTAEMMAPSQGPLPPRGTLGAAASQPVFRDSSGRVISSIVCGQPYTFDVPGYTRIWLTETRNGVQVFDGEFAVPMPSYVSSCVTDPGTYQLIAYDLASGMVLGTATFVVQPATGGSAGGGTTGTGTGTDAGAGGTPAATFSASPGLIIAGLVGLYFLFGRKSA